MFLLLVFVHGDSKLVRLTFCDVGQGDATLITFGSKQILIDTGRNSKVLQCLERKIPFWDKKIEFLVLTHMDADHIGGAPEVMDFYTIDFIFINPSEKKTSDFDLLEQAISRKKEHGTKVIETFLGQKIRFSNGFYATVISPAINFPQVESQKNLQTETRLSDATRLNELLIIEKYEENDLSIALFITFGSVSILLPGDLESNGELAIMSRGLLDRAVLLKAGHHGSKTSSTPGFVERLQPEITVISSGKNNAYNHPHPRVLETFSDFNIGVYQTKISGELNFATNGSQIWEERI